MLRLFTKVGDFPRSLSRVYSLCTVFDRMPGREPQLNRNSIPSWPVIEPELTGIRTRVDQDSNPSWPGFEPELTGILSRVNQDSNPIFFYSPDPFLMAAARRFSLFSASSSMRRMRRAAAPTSASALAATCVIIVVLADVDATRSKNVVENFQSRITVHDEFILHFIY